jgi:hypothetical protein
MPITDSNDPYLKTFSQFQEDVQRLKESKHIMDFAQKIVARLPSFDSLTPVQKYALGNGSSYYPIIVTHAYIATRHAFDKKEYVRLLGLDGNGYRSHTRSETFAHCPKRTYAPITMGDWKREMCWLYHRCKEIHANVPSTPELKQTVEEALQNKVTRSLYA